LNHISSLYGYVREGAIIIVSREGKRILMVAEE
jgi:hypothetical protein